MQDKRSQGSEAAGQQRSSCYLPAFKVINEFVKKEWQRQWQTMTSCLQTRELVREVSTKLSLPKKRTIAISCVRALLNLHFKVLVTKKDIRAEKGVFRNLF